MASRRAPKLQTGAKQSTCQGSCFCLVPPIRASLLARPPLAKEDSSPALSESLGGRGTRKGVTRDLRGPGACGLPGGHSFFERLLSGPVRSSELGQRPTECLHPSRFAFSRRHVRRRREENSDQRRAQRRVPCRARPRVGRGGPNPGGGRVDLVAWRWGEHVDRGARGARRFTPRAARYQRPTYDRGGCRSQGAASHEARLLRGGAEEAGQLRLGEFPAEGWQAG